VCPKDNSPLQADITVSDSIFVDPLIGHTLDEKYRLEERLGIGGMGTVYRARHLLIDRAVAIKVLNQRFVEDDAAQARFRREAKAAGRLQHPNAVTVTDFGQTSDGYVYIVMELLVGRTLREVLAKEAPLDAARAVSMMLQISAAVAAAHEAGIIHRDLKPTNIFIVQRSEVPAVVKVLDFGIAKLAAEAWDEDDPKNITIVGAMIGTPRYMSPEQCEGAELTPAADVYSLGVMLYEMLSGSVPFSGSTPVSIALKHASELPRSPREIVSSIPEELERIVLNALDKRPENRPVDAAQFRQQLYEAAERLGLEHASITSAPDLEALRGMGTESPSGRLVIDISRLRENRAATSGGNEVTVVSETRAAELSPSVASESVSSSIQPSQDQVRSFPRVAVPLNRRSRFTRASLIVPFVALALILGATLFALRPADTTPDNANVNAVASPSPSVEPSPSPSPSRSPQKSEPKPSPSPSPTNTNSNKGSKVGSILKKAGRILKKPF
jgi:serine/threonine protein kinase